MPDHPPREILSDPDAQALSALVDGEASPDELQRALSAWRHSDEARRAWRTHHLIGDVLRSGEPGVQSSSDAQFLARFRQAMAHEPVVLAPAAMPSRLEPVASQPEAAPAPHPAMSSGRGWAGSAGMAAAWVVMAVVAVGWMSGSEPAGQGSASTLAVQGGSALAPALRVSLIDDSQRDSLASPASFRRQAHARFNDAEWLPNDMVMLRDPQIDQALARHAAELGQPACAR